MIGSLRTDVFGTAGRLRAVVLCTSSTVCLSLAVGFATARQSFAGSLQPLERLVFEPVPMPGTSGDAALDSSFIESIAARRGQIDAAGTGSANPRPDGPVRSGGHPPLDAAAADDFDGLMALGTLQQELERHHEALETFSRARHVARVETGLYSDEQIHVAERSARSLAAIGLTDEADDAYEDLVRLHRRRHGSDSLEIVAALADLAEWKLSRFHRDLRGGNTLPAPAASSALSSGAASERESRRRAFASLGDAQASYLEAIDLLVDNERYADDRLLRLEEGLVETFFLEAYRDNLIEDPVNYMPSRRLAFDSMERKPGIEEHSRYFRHGEDAYIRMLSYLKLDPSATVEQFSARLVGLGDWYMLFGFGSAALEKYRQAYDLLTSSGAPEAAVAKLFEPEVPVQLPTFTPTPHSPAMFGAAEFAGEAPAGVGYVDLKFTLNARGRATAIDPLGESPDTPAGIRDRLIWMVRDAQFRPPFQGGVPVERAEIRARYYYRYPSGAPR
ncbi:MAG: tetratricopeptide repeat protein [Gammaproteobacteria bacterium]|nr:tetratricopeptide repeat protein [Gammaproteobacteria bacterium]